MEAVEIERREKRLRLIWWVAIIDALLLVPLVIGVLVDSHITGPVIGPIHGFGFLLEIYLAYLGSRDRWWGYWYPVAMIVTLGPPGAILGHPRAKREALEGEEKLLGF